MSISAMFCQTGNDVTRSSLTIKTKHGLGILNHLLAGILFVHNLISKVLERDLTNIRTTEGRGTFFYLATFRAGVSFAVPSINTQVPCVEFAPGNVRIKE